MHIESKSVEMDGGVYLLDKYNNIIGGPFSSNEEADKVSRHISSTLGEAPLEEYRNWVSGYLSGNQNYDPQSVIRGSESGIIREKNYDPKRPLRSSEYSMLQRNDWPEQYTEEDIIRMSNAGKLGLSGQDWLEHLKYSESMNLPYDASPTARYYHSMAKTDDLIKRMEEEEQLNLFDKLHLTLGAAKHQGLQGLLNFGGEGYPNYYDFAGNMKSIWD
jgi:hypothetical protein